MVPTANESNHRGLPSRGRFIEKNGGGEMKNLVILFSILFTFMQVSAASFSARVIAVVDGDTIKVLIAGSTVTIRVANIDAPEKCQPYGLEASAAMAELALNSNVRVNIKEKAAYGHTVADVVLSNNQDLGVSMIDRGAAWVYQKYSDDEILIQSEQNARRFHVGLWRAASPEPPWIWRATGQDCDQSLKNLSNNQPKKAESTPIQTNDRLSTDQAAAILDPIVRRSEAESEIMTSQSYGTSFGSGADLERGATHTGPRGGKYYINSRGNKQYIKR